jgi:hypothetical protein
VTAMPDVNLVDDAGRFAPRVPVNAEIAFWRDGEPGSGRVMDLSISGFFVSSAAPPPVGVRLEIAFTLPNDFSGRSVTGEAIVTGRFEAPRHGFDSRFGQLSDATRRLIAEYIRRLTPSTDPSA